MTMPRTGTLAAFLTLTSLLPAQNDKPVQDCLPASTWAMAAFGGLERCNEAIAGHATARLVQDLLKMIPAELRESQLGSKLDEAAQGLREGLEQGSLSPSAVRAVLQRPMAIGIGRLTIQGMGPSFALVVDEGNAAADLDRLIEQVVAARVLPARIGKGTAAGIDCRTLEGEEMPTVFLARDGGRLIVTNSEGYLTEILRTARGEQPSLAAGASLGAQRARLQATPLVEMFANPKPFLGMWEPMLPYEAPAIGKAIGIESVQGFYFAAAPSGDGTVETIDLQVPGDRGGLLKAALAGAADLEAAKWFDDETLAFAALRLDLPTAIAAFDQVLDQLPRPVAKEARRDIARDIARDLGREGISTKDLEELIGALHGSVSIGLQLEEGAIPLPSVLAIAKVRDEAVVSRWLDRLREATAQQGGIEWKTRKSGDVTVHYCAIEAAAESKVPLVPSFALVAGNLIVGSQVRAVIEAIKQHEQADASLFATADFAAAAKAEAKSMAFLHLRPGRAIEKHWKAIETWVLPQLDAQSEQLGFGSEDLPEPEVFARGLGTMTLSATCDEHGVRLRSRGNLGLGGVLAAFGAVCDDVLQRASTKAY